MFFEERRRPIHFLPAQLHLTGRLLRQTFARGEKCFSRHDGECLLSNRTEWRRVVDIEQQHTSHAGRFLALFGLGQRVGLFRSLFGFLLDLSHVMAEGLDEIVSYPPVAPPSITQ